MARPGSVRGRRGGKQAEDPRSRWLTTYADAVTLLMAFFILLYAMSEIDVIKFTAFLEGLRVPFGNEAGDGLLPESDGLQPDVTPVNPAEERPEAPDRLDQPADHEQPDPPDRIPDGGIGPANHAGPHAPVPSGTSAGPAASLWG